VIDRDGSSGRAEGRHSANHPANAGRLFAAYARPESATLIFPGLLVVRAPRHFNRQSRWPHSVAGNQTSGMPLIDVTYDAAVADEVLHRLAAMLPDAVAEAVDCPDEPQIGPPEPGDIEIRFRKKSQLDVGDLDVVIEVRTKLFGDRVQDKQRRVDLIRDRLSGLPIGQVGVWLILSEGAWSQS
jgi:hypothetical protein